MFRLRFAAGAVLCLAACAEPDRVVVVAVTAQPIAIEAAHLDVLATVAGEMRRFDVPLGGGGAILPPERSFGIVVPAGLGGAIEVRIDAYSNAGLLATGRAGATLQEGVTPLALSLCALSATPSQLVTPEHCGACGNACPGLGFASTSATCDETQTCRLACRGKYYDVDNDAGNGCEALDDDEAGASQGGASGLGSTSCSDNSSARTLRGKMYSDSRRHESPSVDSFDEMAGTTADWWSIHGTGGFTCNNNYSVTFTTTGGGDTSCYRCTITTDRLTRSVTVNGHDSASMSDDQPGQYSNGSVIYIAVEKTCTLPVQEAIDYRIDFHI